MMTFLRTIDFDEGWQFLESRIMKLRRILEGHPEPQFDPEEYMMMYTHPGIVFNMCNQKHPDDHSRRLYDKYKEIVQEYISSMVLPSLREKHGEFMLQELVKCWMNHKLMVKWLYRFFHYLDSYFVYTWALPSLNEVALTCFCDMVYEELKGKAKDVVIALINRERGEMIDRALLKNVLDIYVEIGMGQMNYYVNDFENDMLAATAAYYSQKASKWIMKDSCPDYMLMAEYCLRKEKERVFHYLHPSSEPKLLEADIKTIEKKVEDRYLKASQFIQTWVDKQSCSSMINASGADLVSSELDISDHKFGGNSRD